MPRPAKKRRVCFLPKTLKFQPKATTCKFCEEKEFKEVHQDEPIFLTVDEYEVIRLIDYKGLDQKEAAMLMGVARTTIQAIYSESRKKLARMLIESKPLEIKGGNFDLFFTEELIENDKNLGKVNKMEIIIPVNENCKTTKVSDNLGRANFFLVYNLEKDTYNFIENGAKNSPNGTGVQVAQTLIDTESRVLLTPRCGMKAGKVLDAGGFKLFKTVSDDLEENIKLYKENKLEILEERHMGKHGGK